MPFKGGLHELEPKELEPQQVQLDGLYGPCQVMLSYRRSWVCLTYKQMYISDHKVVLKDLC